MKEDKNIKTHYRKVFKSDHLGVADLEDLLESNSDMIFTISHVRQEIGAKVAGKKIDANIAYFAENIKPLCLNATNSKVLKKLTGSVFVEDWSGIRVKLYIDPSASFAGERTGGVRINPNRVTERASLKPGTVQWDNAVKAYKRDGDLKAVLKRVDVSKENQALIKDQADVA